MEQRMQEENGSKVSDLKSHLDGLPCLSWVRWARRAGGGGGR